MNPFSHYLPRRLATFFALAVVNSIAVAAATETPLIVAHRGASKAAPENTLSAFNEAWQQGADGIEGDFYLTADHHIVCIHDATTLRTGGKKIDVESSTLAELRELEYGSWKDPKFAGEQLPTFEEVAGCVPLGKLFVIELKSDARIVPHLKQAIAQCSLKAEQLLIISFHASAIAECKRTIPAIRAHWLTGFKQDALGNWAPSSKKMIETVRDCGADGVGMKGEPKVLSKQFIDRLLSGGVGEFHIWTVDDAQLAREFANLGACGITTNEPSQIRKNAFPETTPGQ